MRLPIRTLLAFGLTAAAFTVVPSATSPRTSTAFAAPGDAVLLWNENAGEAATAACLAPLDNPLHESRMYAMMHIAIHDALNAIDRRSRPYAYEVRGQQGASPDAAVAAAARTVLATLIAQLPSEVTPAPCITAGLASTEADYTAALAMIPDSPAKTQGVALGQAAAGAILARRASDGAVGPFLNFDCPDPEDTEPGEYQCTPGTPFIAFEGWENVTPFVLNHSSQFRPRPPYRVTSKKYAADYNEVKSLGGDGSLGSPSARTPDQTQIALYWWESSPLKWNRVARIVSTQQHLDLWENARLFGLLNISLADGYIAMVAAKNHFNFWRPITAIRNGERDENPDTAGNAVWTPLRGTPPNQDYPSGHSIEGGAGAEVLKQFFGTDEISFQDCSATLPIPRAPSACGGSSPVLRSYTTFTQAALENAHSRIFIGFHFRKAVEIGTAYGRKIGKRAANLYFRPVD
jgi:PAP2 superfamily